MEAYLTSQAVLDIPERCLPLLVLSDNLRSFFGWAIKAHEHGCYNHLMWMVTPGFFHTQDVVFRRVPATKYLDGSHRLKFWTNINWNAPAQPRLSLLRCKVRMDAQKKWWKRLYDPLAIVGQAFNMNWIQIPGIDICSDKASYLKLVDREYDLKHPSPTDVNRWCSEKRQQDRGYRVLGV